MRTPSSSGWLGFLSGLIVSKPPVWRAIKRYLLWPALVGVVMLVVWVQRHPLETTLILGLLTIVLISHWSGRRIRLPRFVAPPQLNESTTLYRWFNTANELLYVGISNNVARRTDQHNDSKAWWNQVDYCRVERFASRGLALAAETEAIHNEHPIYNIAQNGRKKSVWL